MPHELILQAISSGEFILTLHARIRMSERNITYQDIQHCGKTGLALVTQDEKLRVIGKDLDDERLTLICSIEDGIIIITLF